MLELLLAFCLIALPQDDDHTVTLKHDVSLELTLGPDDPVLEGVGPSKTLRFDLQGDDSVLFLSAGSEEADLILRVKLEGEGEQTLQDDDSGGGTTPFLRLERKGGGAVEITVAAKEVASGIPLTIRCFEAQETAATRAGVENGRAQLEECQRLAASDPGAARALLSEAIETLLTIEGCDESDAVQSLVWEGAVLAYQLRDVTMAFRGFSQGRDYRKRTLPADHPELQLARVNLGSTYFASGNLFAARPLLESALEVYERTLPGDHPDVQSARNNLAAVLATLGNLDGARELFEQVLEAYAQTLPEDDPDLQKARVNLAFMLDKQGEPERAFALLEKVHEAWTRTLPDDHPDLQQLRASLALKISDRGEPERARDMLRRVVEVYARILPDGHSSLQMARTNLASILMDLGELQPARELLEQVLDNQTGALPTNHPQLQQIRMNLALALQGLGDLPAARVLLEQVVEVYADTLPDDNPEVLDARMNLATVLANMGELERARALFERVLEVRARTLAEEHPDLQAVRGNLSLIRIRQGDWEGARAILERVLELSIQNLPKDHPDLQKARTGLAAVLERQGELARALELREEVVEVYTRTLPAGNPSLQVARGNLAISLMARGDAGRAGRLFESVLKSLSQVLPEGHPDLQEARVHAAEALVRSGDAEGSRRLARDLASAAIPDRASLDSFWSNASVGVATVLSISAGAGVFEEDLEGQRLGFSMVESLRMAPATLARLERLLTGDAESERLRRHIARVNRSLGQKIRMEGSEEVAFDELVRERETLRRELLLRLEAKGGEPLLPRFAAKEIAARLEEDEAAVAYWRYDRWTIDDEGTAKAEPSYLAWVLTPGRELRRFDLGAADEIDEDIGAWRRFLGGAGERGVAGRASSVKGDAAAAAKIRSKIFDPLREALGEARRLWVAPAAAIHQIPFEALPSEEGGFLGDRFEVAQLRGLSELTVEESTPRIIPGVLALGGIDYEALPESHSDEEEGEVDRTSAFAGAPDMALRESAKGAARMVFEPLPATEAEVHAIEAIFSKTFEGSSGNEVTLLRGDRATREAFEALAPRYRFIHLATHGWFAPESVVSTADDRVIDARMGLIGSSLQDQVMGLAPSLLCGLAFAGANGEADRYGRVQGVMTAEEIGAMDLTGVELCVLSACETSVGVRRLGRGIASLQAALHAAGVRTAITSLWKVPDEATRQLMTEFYRRLWVLKEPKAKALWNAKQALRMQRDTEGKPVYTVRDWAAWVLSGDPN